LYGHAEAATKAIKYLSMKLKHYFLFQFYYDDEDTARNAVKLGKIWGFMTFPEVYSNSIYIRTANSHTASNEELQGSQVILEMDMTSKLQ
jgi:hypothetical protein